MYMYERNLYINLAYLTVCMDWWMGEGERSELKLFTSKLESGNLR